MSDPTAISSTGASSADKLLKPLEEVAHKAGAAVGAERPLINCPIARPFLKHITGPQDVKKIPAEYLPELASEIREKINSTVQVTGGHLSSNLGVTELTIALHKVFDFNVDRLVLDVGHQVYPHKLLTGRYEQFHTLRQKDGISGYPNPAESHFDLFMTAHAGCAVSSTLGLAVGDHMQGKPSQCIAVCGDGALTAGLVFEAMNNAGWLKEDMLVILNDNEHSISPITGALSATCANLRANHFIRSAKAKGKELLEKIPYVGKDVERFAEQAMDAVSRAAHAPGSIFLDLGFRYYGPVDGHDIDGLIRWLTEMKTVKGPKLLHIVTKKGAGLPWAEKDAVTWHGAKPYEVQGQEARIKKSSAPTPPSYTRVISDAIVKQAKNDEKIVAITAAMREGTELLNFQKTFPKRYFDVGICEQHAVTFAAALAKTGIHPIACIYSSFLQRAVDQLMHDVSLQDGLPVVFCIDRAGVVGDDGPTHGGVFDLAYMRAFPFFVLMAPKDQPEAEAMVEWAVKARRPVAIRYPRDNVPAAPLSPVFNPIEMGKGEVLRRGEKLALLAYGAMTVHALEAADKLEKQGVKVTVANARFCKPFDTALLTDMVNNHEKVITLEDHQLINGFGSAALETASDLGLDIRKIKRMGIGDSYVPHGPRKWQLAKCGLDADGIVKAVLAK